MSTRAPRYTYTDVALRSYYLSIFAPGAATNFATHSLYNSSPGPTTIVVRGISWNGASAASAPRFQKIQGLVGTVSGTVNAVYGGESAGAGQHAYVDRVTQITTEFTFSATAVANASFQTNPPVAVLPPGWSWVWQNGATTGTVVASFFWEELDARDIEAWWTPEAPQP